MRILALDLSLTATGAVFDCHSVDGPDVRLIRYPKLRGWERNHHIVSDILDVIDVWRPEAVAIEGYSFGSKGRSVFDIAELGGVVRWELRVAGIPWADVPPSSLKKYATGKGNASKDEVIAAAIRRFAFPGHDNNEADAWVLWHMAHDALAGDSPVKVPAVNASALTAVGLGPGSPGVGPSRAGKPTARRKTLRR